MRDFIIKILTIIAAFSVVEFSYSNTIIQENAKTHLRWNIFAPKSQLVVEKDKDKVYIKTLNVEVFEQLSDSITKLDIQKAYIKDIKVMPPLKEYNISTLAISLQHEDIELFNYYKEKDRKYVIDFWVNADRVEEKKSAVKKIADPIVVLKKKDVIPPKVRTKKKAVRKKALTKKARNQNKKFRDFRYGSSFVWDYPAMIPEVPSVINIDRKTAEYFYPIKNRDIKKDEREAHLQLSINLFRKKKWGLMYKSIKLYQKKYGDISNWDINEYLKANAVLKNNFLKGNEGPIKAAVNMYTVILEKSKDYELRKGLYKYIITYYVQKNDLINALDYSKKFYLDSKENFDYEESVFGIDVMFSTLAQLNQIEQLNKLMKEKTILKLLSSQKIIAYKLYTHLRRDEVRQVIKYYNKVKSGLAKPVMPSILFNIGEALFRESEYEKAITHFDNFATDYSYTRYVGKARNRIALSYELLEKDEAQTLELYKNAIDRNSKFEDAYEARVRFVALNSVRRKNISEKDREIRVFLEVEDKDSKKLDRNLKQLLWLTRLRTFIVDKKYHEALSYLNAIPTHSFRASYRRVYLADGAEIIYGIITDLYKKGEFAEVVKEWEVYKDVYIDKVASDPYLNFIVGHSYIKLGLTNGFDRIFDHFYSLRDEPSKTFPLWVPRDKRTGSNQEMLLEMEIVRHIFKSEYRTAARKVIKLMSDFPANPRSSYYGGVVYYKTKSYKKAMLEFEKYISHLKINEKTDINDTATLFEYYADSVYKLGDHKKYHEVAKAIIVDSDVFKGKSNLVRKVREKIHYLLIESLVSQKSSAPSFEAQVQIKKFNQEYKKSFYTQRVNYLLGMSLINNNKVKEAKKIFEGLLNEEGLSNTLKELINSELTLLKIKNKT